jgi:hypothetical protein
MNYPFDPDATFANWHAYLWPVGIWLAITSVLLVVIVRRRIQVGLTAFLLYITLSGTVVGLSCRWQLHGHTAERNTSGSLFGERAFESGQGEALLQHVNGTPFKLECGRHLAPRDRLISLLDRTEPWELRRIKSAEDELFAGWEAVARADDLTEAEKRLMERWFNVWNCEADHAGFMLFALSQPKMTASVNETQALWTTSGNEESTSFDYPPCSSYVRDMMRKYTEVGRHLGLIEYCRKQLNAANDADRSTGLDPDPTLQAPPSAPTSQSP